MQQQSSILQLPDLAAFDLDAYCARIGYHGGRQPSLATLRDLQWRHISSIAFENLSCLAGDPVPLDLPALQAKMVQGRRGGYCFEHNLLFAAVLQRLGFVVTGLAARVLWKAPPDRTGPRTHMLLKVDLPEGTYITDTGFGGASLPGPLELVAGHVQSTPIEPYRLLQRGDSFHLEVQLRDAWQPVYSFDLQPQQFADYEVANWFVAAHPTSRFTQVLMVALPAGQRRQSLFNDELKLHDPDGRSENRRFTSIGELRATLAGLFGIEVPAGAQYDAALGRILARPAA